MNRRQAMGLMSSFALGIGGGCVSPLENFATGNASTSSSISVAVENIETSQERLLDEIEDTAAVTANTDGDFDANRVRKPLNRADEALASATSTEDAEIDENRIELLHSYRDLLSHIVDAVVHMEEAGTHFDSSREHLLNGDFDAAGTDAAHMTTASGEAALAIGEARLDYEQVRSYTAQVAASYLSEQNMSDVQSQIERTSSLASTYELAGTGLSNTTSAISALDEGKSELINRNVDDAYTALNSSVEHFGEAVDAFDSAINGDIELPAALESITLPACVAEAGHDVAQKFLGAAEAIQNGNAQAGAQRLWDARHSIDGCLAEILP